MARQYYFPDIIRKTTIAFLSVFKNIQVAKYSPTGTILEMRDVPITFAHKNKFIARLLKYRTEGKSFSMYLPHIGVSITGLRHNSDLTRGGHLTPLFQYINNNSGEVQKLFAATPFTIDFSVSLISLHMSEMSMMLEQILPEFSPFKNITIKEFDFFPNFTRDIKVVMSEVTPNFVNEIQEDAFARIEFDIKFSIDCWIYRPLLVSDVVKTVKTYIDLSNNLSSVTYPISSGYEGAFTYAVSGSPDGFNVLENEWNEL